MNIELIISLVMWVVSTEIIYFRFIREENNSCYYSDVENFIGQKMISILMGLMATAILFGVPFVIASGAGSTEAGVGNIAYAWFYGIVLSITLFFGINYYINIWLGKREDTK